MLSLHPPSVSLLGVALADVDALAVDRRTSKHAEERTDRGPHLVFADAPEQRVTVAITRTLTRDEATTFRPGDQGDLRFTTAPSASDGARRTFAATVVILSVEHDLTLRNGVRQRIHAVALSADGAADPVSETTSTAQ
jgi:hypothetical protein